MRRLGRGTVAPGAPLRGVLSAPSRAVGWAGQRQRRRKGHGEDCAPAGWPTQLAARHTYRGSNAPGGTGEYRAARRGRGAGRAGPYGNAALLATLDHSQLLGRRATRCPSRPRPRGRANARAAQEATPRRSLSHGLYRSHGAQSSERTSIFRAESGSLPRNEHALVGLFARGSATAGRGRGCNGGAGMNFFRITHTSSSCTNSWH